MSTPNWNKDLERGQSGELLFMEKWCPYLEHLDGKDADFKATKTGYLIELKTDYYDYNKTGNFAMEIIRNLNTNAPGGPFQSLSKGIHFYVYQFPKNNLTFAFDVAKLCTILNSLSCKKERKINNGTYETLICLVKLDIIKESAVDLAAIIKGV
jgi:hypothetical protein